MENYSGIVPFLWKTFKKPREKPLEPEMVPLSVHETLMEDEEYFLDSTGGNSPKFPKSPGMFGKSPSRFAKSPGKSHKRRNSTGLSGFSLPKLLSSHSQKSRFSY
uniref:Uncharacterized protein n=1 Tax=Physcomitrium patens TaxID=3218 RepID=A0A2K1KJ37_PHYPA|nr:hypothetical protein PHYPA_007466 [Physcomitrium patens]